MVLVFPPFPRKRQKWEPVLSPRWVKGEAVGSWHTSLGNVVSYSHSRERKPEIPILFNRGGRFAELIFPLGCYIRVCANVSVWRGRNGLTCDVLSSVGHLTYVLKSVTWEVGSRKKAPRR